MKLNTPDKWSSLFGIEVRDPDGWRGKSDDWSKPITVIEFIQKVSVSTVQITNKKRYEMLDFFYTFVV